METILTPEEVWNMPITALQANTVLREAYMRGWNDLAAKVRRALRTTPDRHTVEPLSSALGWSAAPVDPTIVLSI